MASNIIATRVLIVAVVCLAAVSTASAKTDGCRTFVVNTKKTTTESAAVGPLHRIKGMPSIHCYDQVLPAALKADINTIVHTICARLGYTGGDASKSVVGTGTDLTPECSNGEKLVRAVGKKIFTKLVCCGTSSHSSGAARALVDPTCDCNSAGTCYCLTPCCMGAGYCGPCGGITSCCPGTCCGRKLNGLEKIINKAMAGGQAA